MIIILSYLSGVLSFASAVHPLHVITYDEKEKELEIISRIFIDDLEVAIKNEKKLSTLNLIESEKAAIDKVVGEYLQQHFKVSLNRHPQKIIYLGHEIENEAMLCYIQVKNVKRWNTIEVLNTVITELHEDQSNLIHVTIREKIKSLRLMKENPSGTLTFDMK